MTAVAAAPTHQVAGRVPGRLVFANGLGSVAYGIKDNGFSTFLLLFYNQVLGMDARLVSLALLIALVFDGLIDPVVGHISDRTDTRWGRRLPYLYLAAIPLGLLWVLLWSPVGAASFPVLLASAIAVRAAVAFCEVPSAALVAEITRDYDERTRLTRTRFLFAWGGGLLMLLLAYGVFLPNAMLARDGYQLYGIAGAALMVITVLVSAIGQHKWVAHRPPPRPADELKGIGGAVSDIRESLGHPAFLVLMFALIAAITSQGITFSLSNYLYIFVWRFPPVALQLYPLMLFASVVGSFLLVTPLHRRFGKREVAIGGAIVGMVFWALPLTLRYLGLWWPDGSTASLTMMFASTFISNMFSVVMTMSLWSMLADVVEASEEQTGRRSEGTFAAGAFFAAKCSTGVGIFVTGFLLSLSGMPTNASPGDVAPSVIAHLTLAYVVCIAVLAIVVALVIRRFPITREDHEARLALLADAALADPEARTMHP
ncbi:Inner membrane symporter YihP [Tsuneonella dongtanensis]|uniref:Inner membrane symporter YihP n=1 Tax=Tsuneonella dongtanensis TaxID=692370 RepID=A0A1B2ADJ6_9SPHN|nr:MFS transporter [Tsuneonella dongtanensis]ANY20171.1 Inner membrane symporter YihP [Tsuneonella dongtanensis]